MAPVQASASGGVSLGPIGIGLQALQAAAQFGIWYELHQMQKLQKAQFHERRHAWLNDIAEQWVAEHRDAVCLKQDCTDALSSEAAKLFDVYVESDQVDIPEVLLLKVRRIGDYLDAVNRLHAISLNRAVASSRSDARWALPEEVDTRQSVIDTFQVDTQRAQVALDSSKRFGWDIFSIPAKYGSLKKSQLKLDRATKAPDLLRLKGAADQVKRTVRTRDIFMSEQGLPNGTVLTATETELGGTIQVRDPSVWRRTKAFFLRKDILRPIPFSESAA